MRSLLRRRWRWAWELADHRYAPTVITDMHLTLALLTATTGLAGFLAAYLSALDPGMAGDARGAGAAGAMDTAGATVEAITAVVASTVDVGSSADVGLQVDAASPAVPQAASTVELAVGFTAQHKVASTVVAAGAASTAAVVDTVAADIGNHRLNPEFL